MAEIQQGDFQPFEIWKENIREEWQWFDSQKPPASTCTISGWVGEKKRKSVVPSPHQTLYDDGSDGIIPIFTGELLQHLVVLIPN